MIFSVTKYSLISNGNYVNVTSKYWLYSTEPLKHYTETIVLTICFNIYGILMHQQLATAAAYRFLVLLFDSLLTFGTYFCFDMPSVLQESLTSSVSISPRFTFKFGHYNVFLSTSFISWRFHSPQTKWQNTCLSWLCL